MLDFYIVANKKALCKCFLSELQTIRKFPLLGKIDSIRLVHIRLISEINSKVSRFIIRDKVAYQCGLLIFRKRKRCLAWSGLISAVVWSRECEGISWNIIWKNVQPCFTSATIRSAPIGKRGPLSDFFSDSSQLSCYMKA